MIINIDQLQVDEFQRYPVNPSRCTQTDPNINVLLSKKGKATFPSNLQTTSSKNHSGQECGHSINEMCENYGRPDSNSSGGEEKKMLGISSHLLKLWWTKLSMFLC